MQTLQTLTDTSNIQHFSGNQPHRPKSTEDGVKLRMQESTGLHIKRVQPVQVGRSTHVRPRLIVQNKS